MAFDWSALFNFQGLLDLVFGNALLLLVMGAGIFIVARYLKLSSTMKAKPVNRSEVERMKFIERMKYNHNVNPFFKYFVRGKKRMGKITHMQSFATTETNGVVRMLVKPLLISAGNLNVVNPLSKTMCLQIKKEFVKVDIDTKSMIIPAWLYLDFYLGIYYDKESELIHTPIIKNDNLFRSDLNQIASIYFAKSQESATFSPQNAHALSMKEKDIQIEMSKRAGKITSI